MDSPIYEDLMPVLKRARFVFIVVAILFGAVLFFYWKIQILDYGKYWTASESNRTREIVIPAPRGILTDRGGAVVLANNIGAFKVSLIRENTRNLEESLSRISPLLGLDVAVLRERIDKYKTLPLFRPIVVKDDLSLTEVSQIEARRMDFPELVIETEPKRSYPFMNLAAHALGYLQELTPSRTEGSATWEARPASRGPTKPACPASTESWSKSWTAWAASGTSSSGSSPGRAPSSP
jgi:penicillin-binding protein 2